MNWKTLLKKTILYGLSCILTLVVIGVLFVNFHPVFGGTPDEQSIEKMRHAHNFNGEHFENPVPTILSTPEPSEYDASLWDFFFPRDGKNPTNPIPTQKFDKSKIGSDSITWIGHATLLINTANFTILTDPVLHRASPIPIGGKSYELVHETTVNDLPEIDVVLISHDHYDHLDYRTIQQLEPKVTQFFVPLGVKSHFIAWDVPEHKLVEMDWYEQKLVDAVNFTFTPSRHFSGRGLTNQFSTQWGSWVITSPTLNMYFSGDTGYYEGFKTLGEQYGPFDIAFLDTGAYDNSWNQIHMMPEQTVQASIDLHASLLLPINWGKFDLAFHPWNEPIIRAVSEAEKRNVTLATPLMGETFTLDRIPQHVWWE